MNRVQDINISDASLAINYINYFFNGDYNTAFSLLNNNPQLDNKAFIANVMNNLKDYLTLLQENIKDNIDNYLINRFNIFQNIIDNYVYIGEYNSNIIYRIYNYVLYNNKHYMYINSTPRSNILPTNTSYWVEIDLTGEKGASGFNLNFRYNWQSNVNYYIYDTVYYDNCFWVALRDNYNVIPSDVQTSLPASLIIDQQVESTNNLGSGIISASSIDQNGILDTSDLNYINDSWQILFRFKNSEIYCNNISPVDIYDGLIWFEII